MTTPDFELRRYADADAEVSLAIQEDAEAMKYLGGPRPREAILKAHQTRIKTPGFFVIVVDSERAGTIGIWETERDGEKTFEMGWVLFPAFHGRGLATAAGLKVLDYARTQPDVTTIYAFPGSDNGASNAICRKLGYEMIGSEAFEFSGRQLHCNVWRIDISSQR